MRREPFYNEPRYYDIAFGWDIGPELDFLEAVFSRHARLRVGAVVDLACGTGRFTIGLAKRGYQVSGIDLSRDMLSYAHDQARAARVPAELLLKDISDFNLYRRFDAAICMTGSVGYLRPRSRLESNLACVAAHLRPGGIYVIDAALRGDPGQGEPELPPAQEWQQARDRVRVRARWEVEAAPPEVAEEEPGTVLERFTLTGAERGWHRGWQQTTAIKLYRPAELRTLVETSGQFELVACYPAPVASTGPVGPEGLTGHRMLAILVRVGPEPKPEPAADPGRAERGGGGTARRRGGRRKEASPGAGRGPRPSPRPREET